MKKSDRDIMEILEAYDATGSAHSAAQLAGVDPKTVRRYVTARDAGLTLAGPTRRPRLIDDYLAKIEEWIDRSKGKVRAEIVHERLIVVCVDEFGPLNLQPRKGKSWRPATHPLRLRATYHRYDGVMHMLAALDLSSGRMY